MGLLHVIDLVLASLERHSIKMHDDHLRKVIYTESRLNWHHLEHIITLMHAIALH